MTYAILVVDKPPQQPWPDGLDFYARQLPKDEVVLRLAENAWLIRIDTDLLALSNIVRFAHKAKFPLQAIFLDRKPDLVSLETSPAASA